MYSCTSVTKVLKIKQITYSLPYQLPDIATNRAHKLINLTKSWILSGQYLPLMPPFLVIDENRALLYILWQCRRIV